MWYWHDHMTDWAFGGGWFMFLFGIIIIGLIVWGFYTLNKNGSVSVGTPARRDPLDIARERYARGEITAEEFENIRKNLH
ncbi:Protein of unknown function DUF2078, membrane [Dehalogenimonas lykanthroporepellens BL-DC-9]|nr:Protein of unknown function DUF2078, membrane [Dehalogenimonas lykanthroporepellens BL-DC-9]